MMRRLSTLSLMILSIGSLLVVSSPKVSSAEPSREADVREGENPFEPILREIGARWGVEIEADRVALNPIQGTVVLRDLKLSSPSQGPILAIKRAAIRANWKAKRIETAEVEGASFRVDLSSPLTEAALEDRALLGRIGVTEIRSSSLSLRSKSSEILRFEGIEAVGKGLGLSVEEQRLAAQGRLSLSSGSAVLPGTGQRAKSLTFEGELRGRTLRIDSLSAKLGGGTLRCTGELDLGLIKRSSASGVTCQLEEVRLQREKNLDVRVEGQVQLQRHGGGVKLTGQLKVLSGGAITLGRWGAAGGGAPTGPVSVDIALNVPLSNGRRELCAKLRSDGDRGSLQLVGRGRKAGQRGLDQALAELERADREPQPGGDR